MEYIQTISRELVYFWYYFSVQLEQIFRYWVLGMVLGSLVSVFGKNKIHTFFTALHGKRLSIPGIIPASLLGIASPLCMYGTIPIAASFAKKGIREDWLAAFMMSSILLNPQLLFYSAALGPAALIMRFTICFLCGITAGLAVRLFFDRRSGKPERPFFNFSGFSGNETRDTHPNLLLRFLYNFGRNVKTTGPYFLAGIALSALFQRYVPPQAFARLFESIGGKSLMINRSFGILMAATIGVPLYVCGGGTIPLLQTWLYNGMSMGGAAAFMISGPATKITSLGALKIVLGLKYFVFYLLFAVLFSVLCGLAIDLFF